MLSTHTSKPNPMFGTFSDKCSRRSDVVPGDEATFQDSDVFIRW